MGQDPTRDEVYKMIKNYTKDSKDYINLNDFICILTQMKEI